MFKYYYIPPFRLFQWYRSMIFGSACGNLIFASKEEVDRWDLSWRRIFPFLSLDPRNISPRRSIKWREEGNGRIQEEYLKRKVQALPINRKEDQRTIDLLIDLLFPLSLNALDYYSYTSRYKLRVSWVSGSLLSSFLYLSPSSKKLGIVDIWGDLWFYGFLFCW